jgi:tripartite-type tricarboxylate transporter receptor subunit TctC
VDVARDLARGRVRTALRLECIVDKINSVLVADLKRPETAKAFKSIGIEARWDTPEEFRAFIASESVKWGKVIRAAGIAPQ